MTMTTTRAISLATTLVATVSGAALPHPRIWITPAEIPRLWAMVASSEADAFGNVPAEAWAKLKARADAFLKAPPYAYKVDIPGREGAPSTEWSYTLSDESPPRHDDSKHYPPWTAMFQERTDSLTTRIRLLSFAALVSDDDAYFERAREIVLHLCAWEGIWTDPSYGGGKPCLDTGHASVWVGIFYDWFRDRLSDEEAKTIRTALADKALAPIDGMIDSISPYHNFTAVIANGLAFGAAALLGEDERAAGWLDHAIARMRLNMDAQGEDGGALEGPMYGTYAANQLADMLWLLGGLGRAEDLARHRYLATLPRYCIALLDPGSNQQPCFGDGGPGAGFVNLNRVLALQGNGDAAWYCREVGGLALGSVRQFLSVDPERIRPGTPPADPSACYESVGYAILRDGYNPRSAFLAFKCGPPEAVVGHNHYDQGSFMLSYNGEWIGWDPGYRSYFDPPKRRYTVGTIGHSSVVLDLDDEYLASLDVKNPGHDQIHLNRGRLHDFRTGKSVDYVRGDVAPAYNPDGETVLSRFDREVLFLKPRVFVIRDSLRAPEPHTFSVLLHGPASSEFAVSGSRASLSGTRADLDAWFFGPGELALRTASFAQAEGYGPWLAATTTKLAAAELLTVLVPRRDTGFIKNPGFEQGMRGWRPRSLPHVIKNHVIDHAVFHSGKASARIDNSGYYYSPQVNVKPGTRLTARWWAKCTAAKGATSIFYYWRGGKSFARTSGPVAKVDEWRQYEFSDVVPEGTEQVCLALQFHGQGQCWYDDVELTSDEQRETEPPVQVRQVSPGAIEIEADGARHLVLSGEQTVEYGGRTYVLRGGLAWVRVDGNSPGGFVAPGSALTIDGKPLAETPTTGGK
jgi:uncharacterized damage-inducible protein DinB